uniref:Uncharacterized protein n=1 Tax=Tetraselmis sp. GSL018 TaxID=582737 RepID=A0A061S0A7_9CHLO
MLNVKMRACCRLANGVASLLVKVVQDPGTEPAVSYLLAKALDNPRTQTAATSFAKNMVVQAVQELTVSEVSPETINACKELEGCRSEAEACSFSKKEESAELSESSFESGSQRQSFAEGIGKGTDGKPPEKTEKTVAELHHNMKEAMDVFAGLTAKFAEVRRV